MGLTIELTGPREFIQPSQIHLCWEPSSRRSGPTSCSAAERTHSSCRFISASHNPSDCI